MLVLLVLLPLLVSLVSLVLLVLTFTRDVLVEHPPCLLFVWAPRFCVRAGKLCLCAPHRGKVQGQQHQAAFADQTYLQMALQPSQAFLVSQRLTCREQRNYATASASFCRPALNSGRRAPDHPPMPRRLRCATFHISWSRCLFAARSAAEACASRCGSGSLNIAASRT